MGLYNAINYIAYIQEIWQTHYFHTKLPCLPCTQHRRHSLMDTCPSLSKHNSLEWFSCVLPLAGQTANKWIDDRLRDAWSGSLFLPCPQTYQSASVGQLVWRVGAALAAPSPEVQNIYILACDCELILH